MYRVRPQNDSDGEGHSSDMADDEELAKIGDRTRKMVKRDRKKRITSQ